MKQLIIARKDLNMSPGKLAAQVSHASMAFITWPIRERHLKYSHCHIPINHCYILSDIRVDEDILDNWVCGSFIKIICEAKNKYQLEKIIPFARELGLKEGEDFFLIKDNCYTDLQPEEVDENGVGRTLTCIGFRPLPDDICAQLSKKYQLYK